MSSAGISKSHAATGPVGMIISPSLHSEHYVTIWNIATPLHTISDCMSYQITKQTSLYGSTTEIYTKVTDEIIQPDLQVVHLLYSNQLTCKTSASEIYHCQIQGRHKDCHLQKTEQLKAGSNISIWSGFLWKLIKAEHNVGNCQLHLETVSEVLHYLANMHEWFNWKLTILMFHVWISCCMSQW